MDTKDTVETTEPLVAPAKPAPAPKPAGELEHEDLVPSVPLSGLGNDSLQGLRAAFSGLTIRGPEGKKKEKEKQAVDMGAEEVHPGDGHGPSDEAPFEDTPVESAPSASDFPAVPSPTTTTLPATHPATSSPTTTPPMTEGLGFTGMSYPTYGVTPSATVPPPRDVLDQGLKELGYFPGRPERGAIRQRQATCPGPLLHQGKNCCYKFYWPSFGMAYGNPGFSELGKVLTKVPLEHSRMVLCSPDWGAHGGNEYWRTLFDKLTLTSNQLPDDAIYVPLGRKTPIGKPGWGSMLSVVNGSPAPLP